MTRSSEASGSDEHVAANTRFEQMRQRDHTEYLSSFECAPILLHKEADALLAVLEAALNDGYEPGVGLRVEDARSAGFKIVSERFRDQEPYNRGHRIVATVARPPEAME